MLLAATIMLANCSSHYNIKKETGGNVVSKVPNRYMNDFNEKKACKTSTFGKDKDRVCIYGTATAVSSDLELAIEKATMKAKAEMADIIKGEMNAQSKQFITELGKNDNKTTVSEVESVIVNVISNTQVRGYEVWAQEVTITKNNYYRAWIGLRLPMGEYNKMYNFTIAEAVDAYNVKEKANIAYNEVLENSNEN